MQNSRLNDIVAQLNAGKPKEAKAEADKEKQQRKKPPVKRAPKAEEDSKVKARPKSDTARAPPTTAAILAASALPGGVNLDPTTAPLPKRVKDVLEFIQARNGTQFTPAQIKEAIGLNLSTDLALLREVHRHPRLTYAGAPHPSLQATPPPPTAAASWYAYLPEIPGISNKAGLLNYVRDHKGSQVQADALRQCYLGAPADLEQLKKDGLVFIVGHPDAEKETVFARDMMGQEVVLDDVRALWFEVMQEHVKDHVPRGMQELQTAVVKAGLRSALANQPIKRVAPGGPKERAKKPRQREININKATNAHLPFLFSGAQPKSLDAS